MTETGTNNPSADESPKISAFFWTMLVLCVLDVILLFWIFNPLRRASSDSYQQSALVVPIARRATAGSGPSEKPSPLGKVAGPRTAMHRSVSLVAAASRRPAVVAAANVRTEIE